MVWIWTFFFFFTFFISFFFCKNLSTLDVIAKQDDHSHCDTLEGNWKVVYITSIEYII